MAPQSNIRIRPVGDRFAVCWGNMPIALFSTRTEARRLRHAMKRKVEVLD